jgi:adhesin transport system outer membrane protein
MTDPRLYQAALASAVLLAMWCAPAGATGGAETTSAPPPASTLASATVDDGGLSLQAVLRLALSNAPALRAKQKDVEAAGHALSAARWGRYPALTVTAATPSIANGAPAGSGPSTTARLEQPLYAWGAIDARIQAAQLQCTLADNALRAEQHAVFDRVIAAHAQLQTAQERLRIQSAALERLRDYQAMIGRRLEKQLSSRNDEALVLSRVLQTQADLAAAAATRARAQAQLEELTNEPVPAVQPLALAHPALLNQQELETAALLASPELASARLQRELADTETVLRRAEALPRVVARYERVRSPAATGGNNNYGQFYVAMEASFGSGLSALDNIQQSLSKAEATEQQVAVVQRSLMQQARSGWADLTAVTAQLPALDEVTRQNTEVVDSFMRQYIAGRKAWLDVLNSERELTQSRLAAADLLAQAGATNQRLLRLAGQLLPDEQWRSAPSAAPEAPTPAALLLQTLKGARR